MRGGQPPFAHRWEDVRMMGGWRKFHTKMLDWRWYTDGNTFRLFFHLIMTANYEDKPWKDIIIKRGQRVTSYDTLAKELHLSVKQIRTALNHLKETNEVAHEGASRYSIITVLKYDTYQAKHTKEDADIDDDGARSGASRRANKGQTKGKQRATTIEDIEDIEDIDTTPLPPSENIPYQKIIEDYNFVCTGLPKVRSLTDGRRKAIRARWNEHGTAAFSDLFAAAAASSFLNGKNDRNWLADFDWMMKEANFAKVLEGKYRDKEVRINGNNCAGGGARYVEQHTDDEYAQFYAN